MGVAGTYADEVQIVETSDDNTDYILITRDNYILRIKASDLGLSGGGGGADRFAGTFTQIIDFPDFGNVEGDYLILDELGQITLYVYVNSIWQTTSMFRGVFDGGVFDAEYQLPEDENVVGAIAYIVLEGKLYQYIWDGTVWALQGGIPETSMYTANTQTLPPNTISNSVIQMPAAYIILSAESTVPNVRFRLYHSEAQRDADLNREIGVPPTGNHGLLLDIVFTNGNIYYDLTPVVFGRTKEYGNGYATLTNLDSITQEVGVSLEIKSLGLDPKYPQYPL